MGSVYIEKEKPNHIKSKVKILAQNRQVWDSDTQVSQGGQASQPRNGDSLWWEAICNEMRNIRPAFKVWEKDVEHIPFDVKMGEIFRHDTRFVTVGHTTETPTSLTYSSVVSRDSVRIILLTAALNGLQVMACDIQNAYLTANCREKIWTYAGPEFGSERGQPMIIRKAIYGLKSSGAAFRAHLAETLHGIGFKPTKADPDVWIPPAVKLDGTEY